MKVKVSKVIARELSKRGYKTVVVSMTYDEFSAYVGDAFAHMDDYDGENFKVLMVSYPSEYYAPNRYITTRDLLRVFSDGMTIDEFVSCVYEDLVEV